MAYNIVRLDKVKATAHMTSVVGTKDMEVGSIVKLGALRSDGEAYDVTEPADVLTDETLAIMSAVPLVYAEPSFEEDFILKAGSYGRAYIPERGDILTYLDTFFSGATVVGQYAVPVNASFELAPAATLTTEKLAFKVIAKETLAGSPATVLEVIRA